MDPDFSRQVIVENAAVACDVPYCSELAVSILKRGGSAVDAAITTALCIGTVNSFSSGIGGGGFMLVRDSDGTAQGLNFREAAPRLAHKHMYDGMPRKSQVGGLAVGVPGELAGLYSAYQKYSSGKLSWDDLIQPVVELNKNGFIVDDPLALAIEVGTPLFTLAPEGWDWLYVHDGDTRRLAKAGDRITRPLHAQTLDMVARNGSSAIFYDPHGPIVKPLVEHIQKTGGIMVAQDFVDYEVVSEAPLNGTFQGREVLTMGNPTSGPALLLGLNIIDGFDNTDESEEFSDILTQRLVEAMKWLSAGRTEFGDPTKSLNNTERINEIMSKEWADKVRKNISDEHTLPWKDYHPVYENTEPHGTSHFSIVDENGMAVSMTTTVNLYFGAFICDPVTGIVLNSEMDDFSLPDTNNAYELRPSIYNFVAPFKRPLSSTVPTIISNSNGEVEMVIGAAGGSRIVTSVFQAIVRKYLSKLPLLEVIAYPRIHHQLLPETAFVEFGAPKHVTQNLESKGHGTKLINPVTAMNGIYKDTDTGLIHGVSDWWRKKGLAAGY
ncbi:gamma-glutamyltranspeptidase [Nadsonia fulvescens var. elongata DSM 6958]|uniref:Gamma-glutamyltranspeptidase n=1 Tax=Nadsonia fulvescens var. elongata DSM 6958 TaxID=857566 RepID=A0A1E3PQK6_9ASCO|nr:gamma-glutamyltranspeptidase [Nadsonia fulvescens var. elongata DSM 6958]